MPFVSVPPLYRPITIHNSGDITAAALSGVTLTSTETNFILNDNLDDVWGEVSAGVNFFNPSANTSVFPQVDVTSGDDVDGVGGKAGMGSLVGDLARNSGFAGPSNPA